MPQWRRAGIELIRPGNMAGPSRQPLVVLVLVVVLIHAAFLTWWYAQPGEQPASLASATAVFRVRATVLQDAQRPQVKAAQDEDTSAVNAVVDLAAKAPIETSVNHAAPAQPNGLTKLVDPRAPVVSEPAWQPLPSQYFSDEQVDALPIPKEDWVLDWQAAPVGAMGWVMTVRLWVSALGDIDHVEVLDAKPAGDWAARMVASLPRTPMLPATLAGQGVPVTYVVSLAPDMAQ